MHLQRIARVWDEAFDNDKDNPANVGRSIRCTTSGRESRLHWPWQFSVSSVLQAPRIIPFVSSDGGADGVGRILAKRLSETIGQQVVVENRPGAAGNIVAGYVMSAEPGNNDTFQF